MCVWHALVSVCVYMRSLDLHAFYWMEIVAVNIIRLVRTEPLVIYMLRYSHMASFLPMVSPRLQSVGRGGWGGFSPPSYNTPVQYIQHTSPVHTAHQSSTYNTPVQYIQHTSPVHTTHQSSTYNTPVQYMQHTRPVHTKLQFNTPVPYIKHTSPLHITHQSSI